MFRAEKFSLIVSVSRCDWCTDNCKAGWVMTAEMFNNIQKNSVDIFYEMMKILDVSLPICLNPGGIDACLDDTVHGTSRHGCRERFFGTRCHFSGTAVSLQDTRRCIPSV